MCNKQKFSKLAVQYITEVFLTYEAANPISHINSQELTSSLNHLPPKHFSCKAKNQIRNQFKNILIIDSILIEYKVITNIIQIHTSDQPPFHQPY